MYWLFGVEHNDNRFWNTLWEMYFIVVRKCCSYHVGSMWLWLCFDGVGIFSLIVGVQRKRWISWHTKWGVFTDRTLCLFFLPSLYEDFQFDHSFGSRYRNTLFLLMHLSVISLIVISILLNLSTGALLIRASKKSDEIMKDRECVFSLNEILSTTL